MLDKRNFYINGKWTDPLTSNDFEVINPSNEEPCAIISLGSIADTNSAVKAAKEAFSTWKQTSKETKISLIKKLYEIMMKQLNLSHMFTKCNTCLLNNYNVVSYEHYFTYIHS